MSRLQIQPLQKVQCRQFAELAKFHVTIQLTESDLQYRPDKLENLHNKD